MEQAYSLMGAAMRDIRECIIFEDNDICVCHKPAGVLTQPDRGFAQDMVSALMTYERRRGNAKPFIAPVNRLDRPVEGLVLYAKNSKSAAALTKQLTQGSVDKYYYAVVDTDACMPDIKKRVILKDYIIKDAKSNMSHVVPSKTPEAKEAVLEYEPAAVKGGHALIRIKLHTGRHHQIRVQLSHAGMPIVGDAKYGRSALKNGVKAGSSAVKEPADEKADKGADSPALCSYRLEFRHPVTGRNLRYEIKPLGKGFADFFAGREAYE